MLYFKHRADKECWHWHWRGAGFLQVMGSAGQAGGGDLDVYDANERTTCGYVGARPCRTKIDPGVVFCSSHSCGTPGCVNSKSSKETTCGNCNYPAANAPVAVTVLGVDPGECGDSASDIEL